MVTVGSVRIAYYDSGKGDVLLLLHGWCGSKDSWSTSLSYITKSWKGRCVALDLPGFGESSEPPATWGLEDYARALTGVLDRLKIKKATLVGHSFGGKLSAYLGITQPERVKKLVLIDPAIIRRDYVKRLAARLLSRMFQIAFAAPGLKQIKPTAQRITYKLMRTHDWAKASPAMRQVMQRILEPNILPKLKDVNAPTLVIWGVEDRVTPFEDSNVIAEAIPGAQLVRVEGARHAPHLSHPTRVAEAILNFLRHHTVESAPISKLKNQNAK